MDRAEKAGIDLAGLPQHLAVIMDGNGRWAQKKGLGRLLGHRQGYKALRTLLLNASDLGIPYLTVYAFSAENWKRPQDEVAGLMLLIETAVREELRTMHTNRVRFQVAGRMNELSDGMRRVLQGAISDTKDNTGITFTLAVNYGGRAEIVDAVRDIVASGFEPEDVNEEILAAHLYNSEHPDPDLMIRTAGEMRWSNFLLWQAAYCELFVTDKPWPEFDEPTLLEALLTYQRRVRKFGDVV